MTDLSPPQILALRRRIADHQLDAVGDLIVADAAACYAMVVDGPDDYGKAGTTRFGGVPDLPPDLAWPCDGDPNDPANRFSNFVAQINFAEMPALGSDNPLPRRGLLYLFVKTMTSAAEPVDLDARFFDGDSRSTRTRRWIFGSMMPIRSIASSGTRIWLSLISPTSPARSRKANMAIP